MSRRRIAVIVCALMAAPACASSHPVVAPSATTVVTSPEAPVSEPASLTPAIVAPNGQPTSSVDVGAPTTARRWIEAVEAIVRDAKPTPPEAARLYAYAAKAYDDARAAGSDEAHAGAAVRTVLLAVQPEQGPAIVAAAHTLGAADAVDPAASASMQALLQRVASDGFTSAPTPTEPEGDRLWHGADGQSPLAPNAGGWTHWLLPADVHVTVPDPPAPGTPEHDRQLTIVKQAALLRDAHWAERINFWGGTPGTNTPSGIWQDVLWSEMRDSGSTLPGDAQYAHAQSILAQTIADAFIETWKVKYTYWTARPDMIDPTIKPAMKDPRFPGYVSGHSTISAAAATVLVALAPAKERVWMADAIEARDSRLVAGIHLDVDNVEGFTLGTTIGTLIIGRLGIRPAPPATIAARPDRLAVPDSIRQPTIRVPDTPDAPDPATPIVAATDGLAFTPAVSTHSPGAHDGEGKLVIVRKPGYERAFVVTLPSDSTPELGDGWRATTLSTDGMWTPAACDGVPTSVVGKRIVYVESAPAGEGRRDVRLVAFDLSTKTFSSYLPTRNDEVYDGIGTAVGDHEFDLGFWKDPEPGAYGMPSGRPMVRRIDLRTGAYRDLTITGLPATSQRGGRWEYFELAQAFNLVHDASGVTAEARTPDSVAQPAVDGITQGDIVGDDVVFTRADGAIHAKIHADRSPSVYGWAGTHGYFMAGNWSDDHRDVTFAPGVYDVRTATWDWAFTTNKPLFVVGVIANA